MAAKELREGYKGGAISGQGTDMIAAVATRELLDTASTRFDPAKAGGRKLGINLVLTDRKEQASVELTETTMIGRMTPLPSPQATLTGPRRLLLGLMFMKLPLEQLEMAGLKVEGDRAAVESWLNALDPVPAGFPIVEP
jgi:alkyl sulfatase BDS1-like metallo-beta-lactamase superfamily hydrolase